MKGNVVGQGGTRLVNGIKKNRVIQTSATILAGEFVTNIASNKIELASPNDTLGNKTINGSVTGLSALNPSRELSVCQNGDVTLLVAIDGYTAPRVSAYKFDGQITNTQIGSTIPISAVAAAYSATIKHWKDNLYVVICSHTTATVAISVISENGTNITVLNTTFVSSVVMISNQTYTTDIIKMHDDTFVIAFRKDNTLNQQTFFQTITINASNVATTVGTGFAPFTTNSSANIRMCRVDNDRFITVAGDTTNTNVRLLVKDVSGNISQLATSQLSAGHNSTSNGAIELNTNKVAICYQLNTTYTATRVVIVNANNTITLTGSVTSVATSQFCSIIKTARDSYLFYWKYNDAGSYSGVVNMKLRTNDTVAKYGLERYSAGYSHLLGVIQAMPTLTLYNAVLGVGYCVESATTATTAGLLLQIPINGVALQTGGSAQTISVMDFSNSFV